jgi:hypothetical protein
MVSLSKNSATSEHDILYYKPDGTLGRVDIVHTFHAQDCHLPKCKNFFDWYINKK